MIKYILLVAFLACSVQGGIFAQQTVKPAPLTIDTAFVDVNSEFADDMSIYPNPATDKIIIRNKANTKVEVTLYNIVGDPLMVKNSERVDVIFDIARLSDGIYIVAFNNGDEIVTQRLVKQS